MARADSSQTERRLAFIVVDIGEGTYADALGKLVDVSEAIDAVDGCLTESFGSFPENQRPLLSTYVEAAKSHG